MKYLSDCDLLVYDLHSGNPKDVELALSGNNNCQNNNNNNNSFEEALLRRREDPDPHLVADGLEQDAP